MPDVGKNAEQLEFTCTAGGDGKWYNQFGKQWDSFLNKHVLFMWYSYSTPSHLPKRNESICPHKDLYTNAHHQLDGQIMVFIQWTTTRLQKGMNQWYMQHWMNHKVIKLSEKNLDQKKEYNVPFHLSKIL